MGTTRKKLSELPEGTQAGMAVATVVQVALAVWAFIDLARRPKELVRGKKPAWIPVILVNWIGPVVYFAFGIKR